MSAQEVVSRPAMESIFLWIANEAVEEAERNEPTASRDVKAHINMQNNSIIAIITSAQALEAFINVEAESRLSPSLWTAVEKLNIVEKWLVVTRLATNEEWDKGKQPFQDFQSLVKLRNGLVHYKPKYTQSNQAFEDDFTGALARKYFDAACGMISTFFEKAKEQLPPQVQPGTLTRGIMEVRELFKEQGE